MVTFAVCKPPEWHRGKISTCIVLGISNYAQQCKENNVKKQRGPWGLSWDLTQWPPNPPPPLQTRTCLESEGNDECNVLFLRTLHEKFLSQFNWVFKLFATSLSPCLSLLFLRFGRHPVLILSVLFMLVFGLSVAFSVNVTMFSTLRFFEGFCLAGLALSLYVLSKYKPSPSHACLLGLFLLSFFCSVLFLGVSFAVFGNGSNAIMKA